VTEYSLARQRLGKHCLKAGIATAAEVNLLGNGTQTPVSTATDINKGIPVTMNRITEDNKLLDMVTSIPTAWQL
jgi:hypothetical protein